MMYLITGWLKGGYQVFLTFQARDVHLVGVSIPS